MGAVRIKTIGIAPRMPLSYIWCRIRDSNSYTEVLDPKSSVSANSTNSAYLSLLARNPVDFRQLTQMRFYLRVFIGALTDPVWFIFTRNSYTLNLVYQLI